MESFFSFLIDVFKKILWFWRVIDYDQAGVKTTCGQNPISLSPGIHFVWPVIGNCVIRNTKEQVKDIRAQKLTTADGIGVTAGLSVAYDILNIHKATYEVYDIDESLHNECLGLLDAYISTHTFQECLNEGAMTKYSIEKLRQVATERWGLRIRRVRRSDFGASTATHITGIDRLLVSGGLSLDRSGE